MQLIEGLDRNVFEPALVILKGEDELYERCTKFGISPVFLHLAGGASLLNPLRLWRMLRNITDLVAKMRREGTHIVHGYLFVANVVAAFIGHAARVPITITSRRSLSTYKTRSWTVLHRLCEIVSNRWTDLVIANSRAVKEDVMRHEHVPSSLVMVIHNGVEWDRFGGTAAPDSLRKELGLAEDARVVGMIANLIHYKNHRMLIAAIPLIKREIPGAHILLIGRDGGMIEELRSYAAQLGVLDSITFTGPRSDIPELLSLFQVSVLTSLEEGFPNAILESMASGVPVVATRVGGVPEAVEEGKTGFMVDPKDPAALADRVIRILSDEVHAREMGAYAREKVREQFTTGRMVRATEEVYLGLLKKKGIPFPG